MDLGMLVGRYHRAFNDRDFDVYREVFAEDVEVLVDGMPFQGVDAAVRYGVASVTQFPGLSIASERIVAESDDTIVTEIALVNGDPVGGHVRQQGTACEIYRVCDGRIVSVRSYYMPEPADRADAVRIPARAEAGMVAEEQAALRRVATLVARGVAQDELFAAVTQETGWLVSADTTSLLRFEADDTLTLVAAWSARPADLPIGSRRPVDEELRSIRETGRSWRRGPADLPPTGSFVEEARALGLRTFVGVPIVVDAGIWGVVFASSTADRPFADEAEARLAGFTELVATAIANAQARLELRASAEEQAALRRVATLVAGGAASDAVFAVVAAEVGRLLEVDFTGLSRCEPDGAVTFVGLWSNAEADLPFPVGTRVPTGGRNVVSLVVQTGRQARIDDFADASGMVADAARAWRLRAAAGVPISVEGRLWGVMAVGSGQERPLPADTEERLAGFTELVATAIANAQARTELRGFAEEQAALRRVATLVARAAPPEEVFAAAAAEVSRVLSADETVLSRYDPDGMHTAVGAWSTPETATPFPVGTRTPLGGRNVTSQVFEMGRPGRIDDYADTSGPTGDIARARGARSVVGVPISVEGRLWGVMCVVSRVEPLPADTEARLAGFTELVATALASAEARAALTESRARIVAAADATRRRIERDLHDGAQQRLVSLALHLRGTAHASPPPETGELTAQMDEVADGLTEVLDELREIARGLHPAALAAGGLRPGLKELARRSAVPVRIDVGVAERLPEPIELAAYYVVAEALTNTAKHADASVVDVRAESDDGILQVRIHDDGRGGADIARGTGIVGLTDRVEALGGRLSLYSPPGAGTTIQVVLPLTAPGSPGSSAVVTGRPDHSDRDLEVEPEPSDPAQGS